MASGSRHRNSTEPLQPRHPQVASRPWSGPAAPACPTDGQRGDHERGDDRVDQVRVARRSAASASSDRGAAVAPGRELQHRDQRQQQVARRRPGGSPSERHDRRRSRRRSSQPSRRARRCSSAYSAMTTATTRIMPSASALPTFAWPRTTSLVRAVADLERHDRAALADQRGGGRVGGEGVREQEQGRAEEARRQDRAADVAPVRPARAAQALGRLPPLLAAGRRAPAGRR